MNEIVRIIGAQDRLRRRIDTTAPGFADEVRRQARLIRDADDENDVMAFIEATTDTEAWDA